MYHNTADFPREKYVPYDNVPPALFERQMGVLTKDSYNVVTLGELIRIMRNKGGIPPKTVVITFDDGYKSNYLGAFPILKKMGLRATFFLIADSIGMDQPFRHLLWDERAVRTFHKYPETRLPLNRNEVSTLLSYGNEIGSHGMTHRSIGNLKLTDARVEIAGSKAILEKATDAVVNLFSYPFGSKNYNDFNSETSVMLKDAGYECACTGEIGAITDQSEPYELPRIPIRETDTPFFFRQKVTGSFDWVSIFKTAFQNKMPRIDKVL